ncbi:AarF/UbiB family protein [Azotobacter bryophylli]|uniref:AarF/UbiB family protein n=1 Tax=Azotobacter bryophylli TaxID=1986537 RepID=A0ABV7AX52_9GAMM
MQRTHARLGALLGFDNPLLGCGHGTAELAHNLTLHERTGHGVRTFAFGELFRAGLPVRQVLLQEYLDGLQTFTSRWRQAIDSPVLRRELLHKLMTMLAALRDAGIAHLDLHPGNVMVSPDPQAPLRTIDCGKMDMNADPALAAALHLGVFCFVMNGERSPSTPRLEDGVRQLLYRLVGDEASFATAEGLLTLLLRYSSRRPFSRRLLLWPGRKSLDLEAIETRLKKLSRRRSASAVDAQSEQRLIESIEAFLNPAIERPILCATNREAAALPKSCHMRQALRQTAQDRASAR